MPKCGQLLYLIEHPCTVLSVFMLADVNITRDSRRRGKWEYLPPRVRVGSRIGIEMSSVATLAKGWAPESPYVEPISFNESSSPQATFRPQRSSSHDKYNPSPQADNTPPLVSNISSASLADDRCLYDTLPSMLISCRISEIRIHETHFTRFTSLSTDSTQRGAW